jgi:hypothetical protein
MLRVELVGYIVAKAIKASGRAFFFPAAWLVA